MLARGSRNTFTAFSKRPYICQSCLRRARLGRTNVRNIHTVGTVGSVKLENAVPNADDTPFRKTLKDAAKQQKKENRKSKGSSNNSKSGIDPRLEKWELTVGIEIHAELNTARKLFSKAATSINDKPNSHVALFDVAFPGTQPQFQIETLIPAIRGALALHCTIQPRSSFDRKHYFYQDQPAGYQITQYYEPFARDGHIILYPHEFPAGKGPKEPITIGIKQVQMEQDTAKTVHQPPWTHLLDFNRVSHPLIEIITLPQIHDPIVAAVCVRKIQTILRAVDACTAGMEMGGLRADVNVSIRERAADKSAGHSYAHVTGLGQRTEIKNLASIKAVEDAIIAERDRQIDLLESGGVVEGETRGWTVGSKTTRRLRGKEGEIDYRYMPDPDIAPVIIGNDVIDHLQKTLPQLPQALVDILAEQYGMTTKDAATLVALNDGDRLEYFFDIMARLSDAIEDQERSQLGKVAGNWVLMELGGLFKDQEWAAERVPPVHLASIISNLTHKNITSFTAKRLLQMIFDGEQRTPGQIIDDENLKIQPLSREEYIKLAQDLIDEKPNMVSDIVKKKQSGKIMWFVGQMITRSPEGSIEPDTAKEVLQELMGLEQ